MEMQHYIGPACAEVADRQPAIVVMHGLSGTGKTRISGALAASLNAIRIRSDVERKRMHGIAERGSSDSTPGGGLYAAGKSQRAYARLRELARSILDSGYTVLLDAAFLSAAERDAVRQLAQAHDSRFLCVSVEAPREILEQRLRDRRAAGADASEADIAVLEHQYRTQEPLSEAERAHAIVWDSTGPAPIDTLAVEVASRLERSRRNPE